VRGENKTVDKKLSKDKEATAELLTYLSEIRLIKDSYEIAEMQKAVDATNRGFADMVRVFGAATTLNIGATSGTMTLRNPTIVGTQTTVNLWNTTSTTVNAFGAATTIGIGAATGTTTVKNNLTVTGVLTGSSYIKTQTTTVAGFTTAATAGAGARSFVTDADSTAFGNTAVGGSTNSVPVWSDGTVWKIG
jgi:hypothetical protein